MSNYNDSDNNILSSCSIQEVPLYNNSPKYRKFYNFLVKDIIGIKKYLTCEGICKGSLNVKDDLLQLQPANCIGSGLCLVNCPDNTLKFNENFEVVSKETQINNALIKSKIAVFFNGTPVKLPYKIIDGVVTSLEVYTAVNETDHMSVWAGAILNHMSKEPEHYFGLEIEIIREENPRDGRMDVCVRDGNNVLIVESKVSMKKAVIEGRFNLQIAAYLKETQKIVDEFNTKFSSNLHRDAVLLLGDKELDLYPINSPFNTGNVGGYTSQFYETISRDNIKFISIPALWCLFVLSTINKDKYSWASFLNKYLFGHGNNDNVGILSAGVVKKTSQGFDVVPLNLN